MKPISNFANLELNFAVQVAQLVYNLSNQVKLHLKVILR